MKNKEHKPHSAACPCEECRKACEPSPQDDSVLEESKNSRLKELSPEAAKTLGYIPR